VTNRAPCALTGAFSFFLFRKKPNRCQSTFTAESERCRSEGSKVAKAELGIGPNRKPSLSRQPHQKEDFRILRPLRDTPLQCLAK